LGFTAPTVGASSFGPHANALSAQPHISSPVPPLSLAIISVTNDSTGDTTLVRAHTVQPSPLETTECSSLNPSAVCLSFSDSSFGSGFFSYGPINGPGIYSTVQPHARIQIGNDVTDFCAGGDGFSMELDQYQFSGGTEQTVALQFACDDGFNFISGTIAYNVVPTDPVMGTTSSARQVSSPASATTTTSCTWTVRATTT
jgi:hypothetical protein